MNERKALFKGLLSSLVMYEHIQTTEQKAKAIKGQADKLITTAKKGGTNLTSRLYTFLTPDAAKKLTVEIAPRFADRNGGYTRLVRLGRRLSDNSSIVLMEWVEQSRSVELRSTNQESRSEKKEKSVREEIQVEAKMDTKEGPKTKKQPAKKETKQKKVVKKGTSK